MAIKTEWHAVRLMQLVNALARKGFDRADVRAACADSYRSGGVKIVSIDALTVAVVTYGDTEVDAWDARIRHIDQEGYAAYASGVPCTHEHATFDDAYAAHASANGGNADYIALAPVVTREVRAMRETCEFFHTRGEFALFIYPGTAGMRSLPVSTRAAGRAAMADAHASGGGMYAARLMADAYRAVADPQTAPTGDQVPTVAELSALIDGDPWGTRSAARDQACMPNRACTDCTILHANGEEPTDMSADDYAAWSAGIAASSHGYTFTLGMLTEEHDDACTPADREAGCDCERDPFRRFTCVMCSRDIAGEAHAMTPWRRA